MRRISISNIGKPVSVIALGTDGFGVGKSVAASEALLDAYVAAGGNVIDSARMYGDGVCEQVVGSWMQARGNRGELVISTKGGFPGKGGTPRLDRESLMSDLNASLAALQTEFIDIWWLHRDDPTRPVRDIMDTLNEMVGSGKVGCVGASNWSAERIREANAYAAENGLHGFAGDQPQWSLARQVVNPDPTLQIMGDDLYRLHRETGMLCMPFSAQAKGYLAKLLGGGEATLSPKAKDRFHFPENIAVAEHVAELCRELGCAPAAMSLAWLTNQPFPTLPIISARDEKQLLESLAAGDILLSREQADTLRKMD